MQEHLSTEKRLARFLSGRDNNLNLVRFVAAISVVWIHSAAMVQTESRDYFQSFFGTGLGDVAVNVFFFVSGLLIVQSWNKKRNLIEFGWARFKRIYPAMWVSTLFFVVVCGALFSPIGFVEFVRLDTTQQYVVKNFLLLPGSGAQLTLPFALDATTTEFNVPLWTLPHELQMYGLVVVLGVLGVLNNRLLVVLMTAAAMTMWIAGELGWLTLDPSRFRLMTHFFVGALVLRFADHVSVSGRTTVISTLALFAISAALPIELRKFVLAVLMVPGVLWFSFIPSGSIRRFNGVGDYSYGTYILAYPIQLYLSQFAAISQTAIVHFLVTAAIVLPMAIFSWHFVERPALSLKLPSVFEPLRTNNYVVRLSGRSS